MTDTDVNAELSGKIDQCESLAVPSVSSVQEYLWNKNRQESRI